MREPVVESDIVLIYVHSGQLRDRIRSSLEELLNSGDGLNATENGVHFSVRRQAVGAFQPITVAGWRVSVFTAHVKGNLRWLPGDEPTGRIEISVLQETLIRGTNFESRLGEEDPNSASGRTASLKIFSCCGSGKICR